MADQLATPEALASALQRSDLDRSTATLWIEIATAVVQEAAGLQRLVEVVDDEFKLIGGTESVLFLPQRPVTAVASVTLDGVALTPGTASGQWRLRGDALWRDCGWQTVRYEPSEVAGIYSHGYADEAQNLVLASGAVLGLSKQAYTNIGGVKSESIDDYSVVYEAITAAMEASPNLRRALARQYGRGAGIVKIGA